MKEDIVNCLRAHRFVGAAQVMKLRELLDKLGSVSGLTCEEKDPEEFLNCLTQMLQVQNQSDEDAVEKVCLKLPFYETHEPTNTL